MEITFTLKGGTANANQLKQKFRDLKVDFEKLASVINDATKDFKDLEVTVVVNIENENMEVEVKLPPVSELLKKELGIEKLKITEEEKSSGKTVVADIPVEKIVKIAKLKMREMLAKNLKKAVLQVVGSCVSMPVTIEGKNPKEIIQEIKEGKWDEVIK